MNNSTSHENAGHGHDLREASRRSLWTALALIVVFMMVEVVAGVWTNSLSLLADAAHMISDAAAIALALFAMWVTSRPESFRRTFGFYRAEVIAALANALAMWLIAAGVFIEASGRFSQPPEIQGMLVLVVGIVGLVINVAAASVLKATSGQSLNVEGAFIHVLGDLIGSVGVIIAALLMLAFRWWLADPIIGIVIGILLLLSSGRLLWKVLHVLMQGTPAHIDLDGLCRRLENVTGVTGVHDIHAWTVTTGYDVFSAHVSAEEMPGQSRERTLLELRNIASQEFGISHVTIQLEDGLAVCDEVHHNPH